MPGNLVEHWRVLKACVASNKIIIMQGANAGLTAGSTPDGSDYDRDIVIVSTLRIARIRLIKDGRQVICYSGSTLMQLEKALKPLGCEPHSVIGSSCIGASVLGGICNNSGGALIRRGPAFTQFALFARIDETGCFRAAETHLRHSGPNINVAPRSVSSVWIALPSGPFMIPVWRSRMPFDKRRLPLSLRSPLALPLPNRERIDFSGHNTPFVRRVFELNFGGICS